MSLEVQERISSLIDGELDASDLKQLINNIRHDDSHQATWNRYSLISEALKKNLPKNPRHNLLERVQSALESEPALLSPSPATSINDTVSAEVVELPLKNTHHKSNRIAVGFAVAASVTLATVLGFQFMNNSSDPTVVMPMASTSNIEMPTTQELNIASSANENLSTVSISPAIDTLEKENAIFAEQSIINDGQWTRITNLGSLHAENDSFLGNGADARVNLYQQRNFVPFTRAVNLDATPNN